ncbi:MAG: heme o synthase [Myxococcaceae bacterium]
MNAQVVNRPVSASDFLSLTKPRLSSLVLCTCAGGVWLAPGGLTPGRWLLTLLGTAGTVGAANALNCYVERDVDRAMMRTRNRPLPAGRMEPPVALRFALALAAVSLPVLALGSNLLTTGLGLLALLTYVFVYTPLKGHTDAAMLVGTVPGALPPLMGWTAVTGRLDVGGLVLFSILVLWQLPHFLAIALFRKAEYRNAGLHTVPLHLGDNAARWYMLATTALLVPVTLLLVPLQVAGRLYLVVAAALGAAFLVVQGWGVLKRLGAGWARKSFFFSLVYLAVLFAALFMNATAHG